MLKFVNNKLTNIISQGGGRLSTIDLLAMYHSQFHQHFWCQSRDAFAPIIFVAFNFNSIWQKMCQNMVLCKKL